MLLKLKNVRLKRLLIRFAIALFSIVTILLFFSMNWLLGLIYTIFLFYVLHLIRFSLPTECCLLWLGVPGSGKTTCAAWLAKHYLEEGKLRVFSNVPISGTLCYNWHDDFGHFNMKNSIIICDEAGIYLNGRNWKTNFDDASLEQACEKKCKVI